MRSRSWDKAHRCVPEGARLGAARPRARSQVSTPASHRMPERASSGLPPHVRECKLNIYDARPRAHAQASTVPPMRWRPNPSAPPRASALSVSPPEDREHRSHPTGPGPDPGIMPLTQLPLHARVCALKSSAHPISPPCSRKHVIILHIMPDNTDHQVWHSAPYTRCRAASIFFPTRTSSETKTI